MAVISLYADVLRALEPAHPCAPPWTRFEAEAYYPHRAFFDGLLETYGPDMFGPGGLPGAITQVALALRQALAPAPGYGLEQRATALLHQLGPLLPGARPTLYLGTLFFVAPAATLSVGGRPALALGVERLRPTAERTPPRYWYDPSEITAMIPHEAAHAARMDALGLPPTPRRLSLLDMVMLEGTALTFTDQLIGGESLASFMPADRLAWHRAHDAQVRAAVLAEAGAIGMEPFGRYFGGESPLSGYYVGFSLCQEYLRRNGPGSMRELIARPSVDILRRVGL